MGAPQVLDLEKLQTVADDIDQARSVAKELGSAALESALAIAWWFAEKELRDETGGCSSPRHLMGTCECCREFERLRILAMRYAR